MAFDKFKSFWNMEIKDGVRGHAAVQSVSVPSESGTSHNVRMWLDVYVEGWEPYRVKHHCMVKTSKYPGVGETLPVVVDPNDRERLSVLWDEVQTVDEQMLAGQPGAMPGEVNITMGEPQVINLGGGGDLNEQIQQAMQQEAQPAPQGSGNMVEDRIAQLERLAKLRDSGVLSEAEFEAEKARLLAGG